MFTLTDLESPPFFSRQSFMNLNSWSFFLWTLWIWSHLDFFFFCFSFFWKTCSVLPLKGGSIQNVMSRERANPHQEVTETCSLFVLEQVWQGKFLFQWNKLWVFSSVSTFLLMFWFSSLKVYVLTHPVCVFIEGCCASECKQEKTSCNPGVAGFSAEH